MPTRRTWTCSAEAKALILAYDMSEGLTVLGDCDDLIRLFMNLLDNAVKFTERGGITLSADRGQAGELNTLVSDTGPGIPPSASPISLTACIAWTQPAQRAAPGWAWRWLQKSRALTAAG
jgi:hypothetical protein